jgi:Spy/CpxP family protein refolding chaperone
MRKTTRAVLACAGLALGFGSGTAAAEPPGPEGPGWKGPGMGRMGGMARFLGLSDQQEAEVRKLMEGQRAQHVALREKLEKNRSLLEEALSSDNPDPAAVGELAIEGHRLREQGRALREAQDEAIRGLLTPEQRTKFDAMKALRDEGGPGGFGPPRGHLRRGPGGEDAPRP